MFSKYILSIFSNSTAKTYKDVKPDFERLFKFFKIKN